MRWSIAIVRSRSGLKTFATVFGVVLTGLSVGLTWFTGAGLDGLVGTSEGWFFTSGEFLRISHNYGHSCSQRGFVRTQA